jgi:hypothetical protein
MTEPRLCPYGHQIVFEDYCEECNRSYQRPSGGLSINWWKATVITLVGLLFLTYTSLRDARDNSAHWKEIAEKLERNCQSASN